ncbi:MAG TPA: response regulator [Caulobacteraceae bacterium]|jgi:CheY-like chemotaxis protein|nr:response regulator [Caulobacteraceae bacterium]
MAVEAGSQLTNGDSDVRKVVLVVEDEALVRLNACDMFEDMGFEVVDAADGVEALQVLESRSDIDLIFTDCRMPRMTGPELAKVASERWPRACIVLATAYHDMGRPAWPLIPKPYDAATLERVVRSSLGQPAAAGPP